MHTDEITNFAESYDGIRDNYCGTFACDELARFKECIKTVKKMGWAALPSIIFNTDPSTKPSDHWVSMVKLQDEKSFFMLDSYGAVGFHTLFERDRDERVLKTFLKGLDGVHSYQTNTEMPTPQTYRR